MSAAHPGMRQVRDMRKQCLTSLQPWQVPKQHCLKKPVQLKRPRLAWAYQQRKLQASSQCDTPFEKPMYTA